MSQFAEHVTYGHLSHTALTAVVIPVGLLVLPTALLVALIGVSLPLTLFCAILPDVDHPTSKAHNLLQYLLFVCVTALLTVLLSGQMLTIGLLWSSLLVSVPAELILTTIGFTAIAGGGLSLRVFEKVRPPHRGVTHSVSFGVAVCIMIGVGTFVVQSKFIAADHVIKSAAILAIYSLCGFVSHISADGMTVFSRLNGGIVGRVLVQVRSFVRQFV